MVKRSDIGSYKNRETTFIKGLGSFRAAYNEFDHKQYFKRGYSKPTQKSKHPLWQADVFTRISHYTSLDSSKHFLNEERYRDACGKKRASLTAYKPVSNSTVSDDWCLPQSRISLLKDVARSLTLIDSPQCNVYSKSTL